MAYTKEQYIGWLNNNYDYADDDLYYADYYIQWYLLNWNEEPHKYFAKQMATAVEKLVSCCERIVGHNQPTGGDNLIVEFLNDFIGGELDFLDIIEAYINAEDNVRSGWQLLTDAYQASMYDKPFDLVYHKNWIRKFRSWR